MLTSGGRFKGFTHSQFRQIPALRMLMSEPLVQISPAGAAARQRKGAGWAHSWANIGLVGKD